MDKIKKFNIKTHAQCHMISYVHYTFGYKQTEAENSTCLTRVRC
jgi:hypothetical protein